MVTIHPKTSLALIELADANVSVGMTFAGQPGSSLVCCFRMQEW